MERGKISALQMGLMMYSTIIATGILFLPASTFLNAGRDLWISPILGSITGFLTVFIMFQLNKIYPKDTIIQYSSHILGMIPGKVIGAVILLFCLQGIGQVIWQYGEFVNGYFLPQTPQIVLLGSMILACAFAVRGGVEVVGRLAEMIVPIFLLLFLLIVILLLPDAEAKHLFPILGKGIMPSMKGAVSLYGWFTQFFYLSFFLPFVTDRKKGGKWVWISVITVMLTMVGTNIITLLIFGDATGSLSAPLMSAVEYISIADFLSHLEALVMAIWIVGAYIKICVFYYALVLGTAQWLNLSDYRPIVFPLGFLSVLFAVWQTPNVSLFINFSETVLPFAFLTIFMLIPMILLLIAYIRKGKHPKKEAQKE